jgi:gamma-glutamyltranspeptidase/glutathione hydrolase
VQMMVRIFDYDQNPQAACDAPRWHVAPDSAVELEPGYPPAVAEELRKRGHMVKTSAPASLFGGGQLIYRLEDAYVAASDMRKDGQAVGF